MYKLLKKLFGWDYIYWQNSVSQGIARVRIDAEGNPYYYRYKNISLIDSIDNNCNLRWLTCARGKYITNKDSK